MEDEPALELPPHSVEEATDVAQGEEEMAAVPDGMSELGGGPARDDADAEVEIPSDAEPVPVRSEDSLLAERLMREEE